MYSSVVDAQRDVVFFFGGSTRSLIVPGECIRDVILLTGCMNYCLVETTKKILPTTEFLSRLCSIHDCRKWLVISQDCELGSSQLSFKELYRINDG